ncbi:unnamed protein product [Closterium sp. NIES-64]|nr:unnamed protein product [Closterium sp. NIES-64]
MAAALPQLRELKLYCYSEELPGIVLELTSLTSLTLQGLSLASLPQGMSCLCRLRKLELINCDPLQELPECLSQLQQLILRDTSILSLPANLVRLTEEGPRSMNEEGSESMSEEGSDAISEVGSEARSEEGSEARSEEGSEARSEEGSESRNAGCWMAKVSLEMLAGTSLSPPLMLMAMGGRGWGESEGAWKGGGLTGHEEDRKSSKGYCLGSLVDSTTDADDRGGASEQRQWGQLDSVLSALARLHAATNIRASKDTGGCPLDMFIEGVERGGGEGGARGRAAAAAQGRGAAGGRVGR